MRWPKGTQRRSAKQQPDHEPQIQQACIQRKHLPQALREPRVLQPYEPFSVVTLHSAAETENVVIPPYRGGEAMEKDVPSDRPRCRQMTLRRGDAFLNGFGEVVVIV